MKYFSSDVLGDVLGDVGADETTQKLLIIKRTFKKSVYLKTVGECKILRYLIHNMIGRNLNVMTQIEYDNIRK